MLWYIMVGCGVLCFVALRCGTLWCLPLSGGVLLFVVGRCAALLLGAELCCGMLPYVVVHCLVFVFMMC